MKPKTKQKASCITPTRMKQYRAMIHTNVIKEDGTIDSLKEEIAKVVLKWLNNWVDGNKGKDVSQTVKVTVNGLPGGDPPENPTTVNIITMVINCQNSNNSDQKD